jgi:hypothetical protein
MVSFVLGFMGDFVFGFFVSFQISRRNILQVLGSVGEQHAF